MNTHAYTKEKINKEGTGENIMDYEIAQCIIFFSHLHFSFMTSQKHLESECIVVCGNNSEGSPFVLPHPRLQDYKHEVNSRDSIPWAYALAFDFRGWGQSDKCRRGLNGYPKRRFLWQACAQHMIWVIFMPLTISHTPGKLISAHWRGEFSRTSLPIWKGWWYQAKACAMKAAQDVSHFLFQWVPNILMDNPDIIPPVNSLFYSLLQILINFLQIPK